MNLEELEQLVGPINRGKLADGFPSDATVSAFAEPRYLDGERIKFNPPANIEDLSWMNPARSKFCQEQARKGRRKRNENKLE